MGRWDEAENLIEKLWGKGEVAVAMEELRAANSSEGEAEDITWSELVQAPYFKGTHSCLRKQLFNLRSRLRDRILSDGGFVQWLQLGALSSHCNNLPESMEFCTSPH